MTPPELSIVLPAWNEERTIGRLVGELDQEVAARLERTEIVVVDDASTDGTAGILAEAAARSPRVEVVRRAQNGGHGAALLEGLGHARGEWLFVLDSDGQFVVREFWHLWERREDVDLVLGIRARRRDPPHRLLLSRVVAAVVSLLAGRRLRDPNVPFRLVRRTLWVDLAPFVGRALAPSIFTVVGAAVRGWRIVEVPVTHLPSPHGGSSLRRWRLVRFSARGLVELLRFRLALRQAPPRAR